MSTELYWMTLTVLMTALFWVPYVLDRLVVRGLWTVLIDTKPEGSGPHSVWAQRAIRAHLNAVENLAIFVPAVLIVAILHISTPVTRAAVVLYFFARLAHFLVYTAGMPVLRTPLFAAGWAAQILLLVSILGWI
ncbi:MAPEG family protein [Chelativorans oligotrophicus]|uniref:MAPEG family protein n=1 Tax=Chelativorans oligotrophicus TaxID=449974 RepID=UPI00140C532D|nr:MAPEG family protein [Chelativorans oligotrophicus]